MRFDINTQGLVENVQVIESSNMGFNEAAVKATCQSRCRSKAAHGLQKLYRFEMENWSVTSLRHLGDSTGSGPGSRFRFARQL